MLKEIMITNPGLLEKISEKDNPFNLFFSMKERGSRHLMYQSMIRSMEIMDVLSMAQLQSMGQGN